MEEGVNNKQREKGRRGEKFCNVREEEEEDE